MDKASYFQDSGVSLESSRWVLYHGWLKWKLCLNFSCAVANCIYRFTVRVTFLAKKQYLRDVFAWIQSIYKTESTVSHLKVKRYEVYALKSVQTIQLFKTSTEYMFVSCKPWLDKDCLFDNPGDRNSIVTSSENIWNI